jgi:tRNA (guanine26-N2/guanine27-N2)-dimethyltransferase
MKRNIEFNGGVAAQKVSTSVGDARLVCLNNMGLFDAVDLDPYGSPAKLLDSAVQVGALAARHSRLERTADLSTQLT